MTEDAGEVLRVPVPCMCTGKILSKIQNEETYEIDIHKSIIGPFPGPISAILIYAPGSDGNYKPGDMVKVMCTFTFNATMNKFEGRDDSATNYLMGVFNERTISDIEIETAVSENDVDKTRFINKHGESGLITSDNCKATLTSGGPVYSVLSAFGYGMFENSMRDVAQNFHRVVSHNPPLYVSREHFGMYSGDSDARKALNFSDEDYFMTYRRFVTQTKSPDRWVSTCEGAYDPMLGPNNANDKIKKRKEVIFSKMVNYDDKRLTIEAGDPGDKILDVRLDSVFLSEKSIPLVDATTPVVKGNLFRLSVGDDGSMDIRAGGKQIPVSNFSGFHMSVDAKGNLKIHSAKTIELSHGDADGVINSIKLDSLKGIDITTRNGLRVNGRGLVNERFLDFLWTYKDVLCQTTGPGAPAPINPLIQPFLKTKSDLTDDLGGFTTNNLGIPATGLMQYFA